MRVRVLRAGVVFAVILAMLAIDSDNPAAACSCDGRSPSVADRVGMSQIAFVGRLDVAESFDDPDAEPGRTYDRRYELVVEQAVKGVEAGDRVIMFGSSGETSCGNSLLDESEARHTVLISQFQDRFVADSSPPCLSLPSADALVEADLSLPATSPGPVSVVVSGRLGEAELVGFDSDGRPVAYGDALARASDLAVCAGGDRIAQIEQSTASDLVQLTTRDAGSLEVINRIDLHAPPHSSDAFEYHLTNGAALTCGVAGVSDVVAVLPWESASDGRTLIIHVDPSSESVAVSAHERASSAAYDPRVGAVVAVSNGNLALYDIDAGAERVVAQLTDPTTEFDYDALFIAADPNGGWWVGLGDGDHELATELRSLAHVSLDGAVERWAIAPIDDFYTRRAIVDGDALSTDTHRVPLPELGSSSSSGVLSPTSVPDRSYGLLFADGRSVRPYIGDGSSEVRFIQPDGTFVVLQGLYEARWAVALPDGARVEPATVDRTFRTARVDSPWVIPHDAPANEERSPATADPSSISQQAGQNARDPETESSSTRWWLAAGIIVIAAASLGAGWSARGRRRTRS